MIKFVKRSFSIKLPAIISDIDGVMLRGGKKINGSDIVVKSILTPFDYLHHKNCLLPFTFLTNGGGIPENEKAKSIANIVFKDN